MPRSWSCRTQTRAGQACTGCSCPSARQQLGQRRLSTGAITGGHGRGQLLRSPLSVGKAPARLAPLLPQAAAVTAAGRAPRDLLRCLTQCAAQQSALRAAHRPPGPVPAHVHAPQDHVAAADHDALAHDVGALGEIDSHPLLAGCGRAGGVVDRALDGIAVICRRLEHRWCGAAWLGLGTPTGQGQAGAACCQQRRSSLPAFLPGAWRCLSCTLLAA